MIDARLSWSHSGLAVQQAVVVGQIDRVRPQLAHVVAHTFDLDQVTIHQVLGQEIVLVDHGVGDVECILFAVRLDGQDVVEQIGLADDALTFTCEPAAPAQAPSPVTA